MTDKHQVEEMAKVIRPILENRTDIVFIPDLDKPIAKKLLKHYQPKIPEGSVVLTGNQCIEIVQDNYNIGYERGSKETARKFAEKIQDYLNDKVCEEFGDNACDVTYFTIDIDSVISDVFEIARQCGAEMEKN